LRGGFFEMKTTFAQVSAMALFALGAAVMFLGIEGCQNLSTSTFRLETTAVDLATSARAGWSNWYVMATNGADASTLAKLNEQATAVRDARLRFAATVGTLEVLRSAYSTNSSLKPKWKAALMRLTRQRRIWFG